MENQENQEIEVEVFTCRFCDHVESGFGVEGFKCKIDSINPWRKRGFDESCKFSKGEREFASFKRISDTVHNAWKEVSKCNSSSKKKAVKSSTNRMGRSEKTG
jgi:hypothetical protein